MIITSPNYHEGRREDIRLVVLHTAECPCEPGRAQAVAGYLSSPAVGASCHWAVDPAETVGQVDEADTAWAAPGANADGIQVEQCAYAGSTDWRSPMALAMIRTQTVPLLAGICRRHHIPAVVLEAADLLAGRRGITDHHRINQAYGQSDHTDCGPTYPIYDVVAAVAKELAGTPTLPEGDTMPDYLLHDAGPAGTVVARYPNGAVKHLAYEELLHLQANDIPTIHTNAENLAIVLADGTS